jgi:hypothetical protein
MNEPTDCWYCGTALWSSKGVTHFAEIETPHGLVRVHKVCRINAKQSLRKITAQPPLEEGVTPEPTRK